MPQIRKIQDDSPSPSHTSNLQCLCSLPRNKQMKILIADDHPLIRKYLYRYLEDKGHHCEEASSGFMCLNMVKMLLFINSEIEEFDCISRCYDAIIINFEVTKLIRRLGFTGVIIGVTENIYSERTELFLNAGATVTISTPIELNAVNKIISKYS